MGCYSATYLSVYFIERQKLLIIKYKNKLVNYQFKINVVGELRISEIVHNDGTQIKGCEHIY